SKPLCFSCQRNLSGLKRRSLTRRRFSEGNLLSAQSRPAITCQDIDTRGSQQHPWRRCEQDIALDRDIAFALAVADLLESPHDLPLMPAVTATISIRTCLRDPASLAHLKTVARSAAFSASQQKGLPPKAPLVKTRLRPAGQVRGYLR